MVMRDFVYHAPTEVVFGKQSEEKVASLVKKYGGHKVLVHYGGKSAKKSGLLDKICGLLRDGGVDFVCLGGVVPNPRLSLVHEGIDLCRKEGVDFILAIGGGSVIDSSKAIACGVPYDGEVWDFYTGKATPACYLPVACVLTIPAAGSEMSESSVITNEDGDVKLGYSNQLSRPKFAIMNPVRTFTLPPYQTAAGVTDMIMHTMERYFSPEDDMDLTDAIAEALMKSMMENVFKVLADPEDYLRPHRRLGHPRDRARAQRHVRRHARRRPRGHLAQLGALRVQGEREPLRPLRRERAGCSAGLHRSRRDGPQGHRGHGTLLPRHRHARQHPRAHRQGSLGSRDPGNGAQVHPRA